MNEYGMKINVKKTKVMCISQKGTSKVRLLIDDQQVEQIKSVQVFRKSDIVHEQEKSVDREIELGAQEADYKEHTLVYNTVCNRDLDVD